MDLGAIHAHIVEIWPTIEPYELLPPMYHDEKI